MLKAYSLPTRTGSGECHQPFSPAFMGAFTPSATRCTMRSAAGAHTEIVWVAP